MREVLRTSRRLGCGPTPSSPRGLWTLPSCLRGVTPPPERSHPWSHRYLPCLPRLDLLSPLWDARAAWHGTLKVPGPPTLLVKHARAARSSLPLSGDALPIGGESQEKPSISALRAELGPEAVGMTALVRRGLARAGKSPFKIVFLERLRG